ncbi:MAG: hypothetical protein QHH14_09360 [Clostridiales bacterium]|nr:hypothetical protein [Clostridiales bacterium]
MKTAAGGKRPAERGGLRARLRDKLRSRLRGQHSPVATAEPMFFRVGDRAVK